MFGGQKGIVRGEQTKLQEQKIRHARYKLFKINSTQQADDEMLEDDCALI
jgi:hypothetical protein